MDILEILNTKDFEKYINAKIPDLKFLIEKEKIIEIEKAQIKMLIDLFEEKSKDWEWSKTFISNMLKDILKKPNPLNGKIYEALVYSWLNKHYINFMPQVKVSTDNCFKLNDYESDGKIENIHFDVKQFGITLPHLDTLAKKIKNLVPSNYYVTVSGTKNISTRDIEKHFLSRLNELKREIMKPENKIHTDYIYNDKEYGIDIRLNDMIGRRTFTSISYFNPYEWAQNNEYYFMYHASQFCTNNPFIIICPFDINCCSYFANKNNQEIYDILRPFCRRMFMKLVNVNDRFICEFDLKAKENIKISTAARKVSAVVFLDVTKDYSYNESRMWYFSNPNADNKIARYQVETLFRQNGACIEDFEHDNY